MQTGYFFVGVSILFTTILLIVFDGVGVIQLWGGLLRLPMIMLIVNPITLGVYLLQNNQISRSLAWFSVISYIFFITYALIQLHFFPNRRNRKGKERYIILHGAKTQLGVCSLYIVVKFAMVIWGVYCFEQDIYETIFRAYYPQEWTIKEILLSTMTWDIIVVGMIIFFICLNASLRVLVTSRRLGVLRRLVMVLGLITPGINIYFVYRIYKISKEEYIVECGRAEFFSTHTEDDLCATKYPIVLVHGLALRDFQYLNYWGRIPKVLKSEGAQVYYGHQAAVGNMEQNAEQVKKIILDIIENTGAEKVNILAHSKGGLESRYMISALDMEDRVASLTTICTPHRGSGLAEILKYMPTKWHIGITNYIDKSYRKLGDKNPDCYQASIQLSQTYCAKFNELHPNSEKVYYQSYASAMKFGISDVFFFWVYCLLRCLEKGPNDGLVSVTSAQWGEYRGCFKNKRIRGVSHADMMDLRRDDILGFDILENYIQIVKELKEMGY